MTRPHFHAIKGSRGMQTVEHSEHPGPDHRHVHEGQPELEPSMWEDPMMRRLEEQAKRAGRPLARRN